MIDSELTSSLEIRVEKKEKIERKNIIRKQF